MVTFPSEVALVYPEHFLPSANKNESLEKNTTFVHHWYLFKEDFNLEIWKTLEDTLIPDQGGRRSRLGMGMVSML